VDSLDLCGSLGFDLEGMQTRGELLCKSGVDESVALHCRLRFSSEEKKKKKPNGPIDRRRGKRKDYEQRE
jgi:hypothetical protein